MLCYTVITRIMKQATSSIFLFFSTEIYQSRNRNCENPPHSVALGQLSVGKIAEIDPSFVEKWYSKVRRPGFATLSRFFGTKRNR